MKRIFVLLAACLTLLVPGLWSQNVGIGTPSPAGKLHIKGSADVSQLIIDAHTTQSNTAPLLKLRNSMGTDLLWMHSDTALNTFIGIYAGRVNNAIGGGVFNTYTGSHAGFSSTTGNSNSGFGANSLFLNATGNFNSAHGLNSLFSNASGSWNTGIGANALFANLSGNNNVALGNTALFSNTTGSWNTAIGTDAMNQNTTGIYNMANGFKGLFSNTIGGFNTANGAFALHDNTEGSLNTAIGGQALLNNTTGTNNTALGTNALSDNESGYNNTALGAEAGAWPWHLYNITAVGYDAVVDSNNKVRVGNASVTSIGGQVSWTNLSDARIKKNIQENIPGLSFIMALRPVTYQYNIDKQNTLLGRNNSVDWEGKYAIEKISFSGFIAQEVETAARQIGYDFSGIDKNGILYGLRYAEFVVPLVKAVQELNQQLIKQNESLVNQLKTQDVMMLEMKTRLDQFEQQQKMILEFIANKK